MIYLPVKGARKVLSAHEIAFFLHDKTETELKTHFSIRKSDAKAITNWNGA